MSAPLWINIGNTRRGRHLKYAAIRAMLRELFRQAGIDKKANPHIFRHSRATFLADYLTEFQMNQYFGWIQGSDMPSTITSLEADVAEIENDLQELSRDFDSFMYQNLELMPPTHRLCQTHQGLTEI
jgi:hypothetical protein